MATIISPNMGLTIPIVGQELGPQYALDINSALSIIDGHNHTPGQGDAIPTAAINYNTDLSGMNNRLTLLKSLTFTPQGSPLTAVTPDIRALYVVGADLYFNDGNGNQIRVTQSGGIVGTPGSISGLTPPASASYNGGTSTFIWQSGINIAAGMDNGPITIRPELTSAPGITIAAPNSLASPYTIALPGAVPSVTSALTLDHSGNLAYGVFSGQQISPQTITQNLLAPKTTGTTVAAGGVAVSNASGSFTTTSGSPVPISNLSVTITTTGRPVRVFFQAASNLSLIGASTTSGTAEVSAVFNLYNGASLLSGFVLESSATPTGSNLSISVPPSSIEFLDLTVNGSPGTYTYSASAYIGFTTSIVDVQDVVLVAYEI